MRTILIIPILCLFFINSVSAKEIDPALDENFSFPDITLTARDKSVIISGAELRRWISIKPAIFPANASVEIINPRLCDKKLFCDFVLPNKSRYTVAKRSTISLKKERVSDQLEALSDKLRKDPVDAKFDIENANMALYSPEEKGYAIDLEKSTGQLYSLLLSPDTQSKSAVSIELESVDIAPRIKSSEINNLGISTLIGEGKSNFKGSTKSRIHNVTVAAKRFDGLIIKPGEEFSFVENLGPVDAEHDYLPELVILNNRTQPEFGGGICQVSTTMFRAAIYSGLEITARKNHAYAVAYYNPAGMDATVYIPKPDLQFKNNTPGHILIKMMIEGTELRYQLYGTDDGRKVEVTDPIVTKKNDDGSFSTVFHQKVADRDDDVLIDEDFKSFYRNPDDFPKPGQEKLTEKPDDWSSKEWKAYKKANNL